MFQKFYLNPSIDNFRWTYRDGVASTAMNTDRILRRGGGARRGRAVRGKPAGAADRLRQDRACGQRPDGGHYQDRLHRSSSRGAADNQGPTPEVGGWFLSPDSSCHSREVSDLKWA